jgi:hypothetical protein
MQNEKKLLEAAVAELYRAAGVRFTSSQMRTIDWKDVDGKLRRLQAAVEQNDGVAFKEAYFPLIRLFERRNQATREFGPMTDDPGQLAPDDTRELLNHIVDQITDKLPQPSGRRPSRPEEVAPHLRDGRGRNPAG